MKKRDLIQAILSEADGYGNTLDAIRVVQPLRKFGQVWFNTGHWWFSEQRAEIATYTAEGYSSNFFGAGEFDVKQEEALRATYQWRTYEERGRP